MNLRLSVVLTTLLVLLGVPRVQGFALIGPNAAYQTVAFGYDGGGAPQLLGEEYRWNIPVLTYAFDTSFIEYFGTNGIRAIEAAFRQINDLPPVSLVTDQVLTNNFPLDSQGINPTAAAVLMADIRSFLLTDLLRWMGLSDAERFTWCLRNRWIVNNTTNYIVIGMNYDPITRVRSDTVNGQRLSYQVVENADVVETDSLGFQARATSVRSDLTLVVGGSFSSLTYDDMGGLRYLYATNNYNTEGLLGSVSVAQGGGTVAATAVGSAWLPVGITNAAVGGGVVGGGAPVTVALKGGIDKVSFVRLDFDSLIGQGLVGVTNTWVSTYIANATFQSQTYSRQILQPDILFSAGDLGLAGNTPIGSSRTVGNFLNNDAINGVAGQNGPGLLTTPQLRFQFSTLPPFYLHGPWPFFLDGPPPIIDPIFGIPSGQVSFFWGFFDETTIYQTFPVYEPYQVSDLESLVRAAQTPIP